MMVKHVAYEKTQYSKTVNVGTVHRHLHMNTVSLKTADPLKQPAIPGNVGAMCFEYMAFVSGLYTPYPGIHLILHE